MSALMRVSPTTFEFSLVMNLSSDSENGVIQSMIADMNRHGPFSVSDRKKQPMIWPKRVMQLPQSTVTLVP